MISCLFILSYVSSSCETEAMRVSSVFSGPASSWLISRIDIRNELLHEALGPLQLRKAVLAVEAMCVFRSQYPAAEALQVGMRHHDFQQPFAQSLTAKWLQDEDIGHISERRIVCHQARETNLLPIPVDAERERALDR